MTKKKSRAATPQDTSTVAAVQSEPAAKTGAAPAAPATVSPPAAQGADLSDLTRLMDAWRARHRKPPATLYHYTNAQGLHGMLATGRVWSTNVGFLNDPSEMRYAARLIRSVIAPEAEQLKAEQSAGEKKDWLQQLTANFSASMSADLTTWMESLLKTFEDQGDAYMTCFCTKGDLLSQWRGYGATGGGYALGFSARQIGAAASVAEGVLLRRVIYKPKEQQEIVRRWVRTFFRLGQSIAQVIVQKHTEPPIASAFFRRGEQILWLRQQGQQVFTKFLAECLICFKDPAYSEEQEWRVIQFGQNVPEIKFRSSGPRLVPYVELALTPPTDAGEAAAQKHHLWTHARTFGHGEIPRHAAQTL